MSVSQPPPHRLNRKVEPVELPQKGGAMRGALSSLPVGSPLSVAASPNRPPLHQSPRPQHQQLHFATPTANAPHTNDTYHPPLHSKEGSLFSPRPNDVYTPLGKFDGTPTSTPTPTLLPPSAQHTNHAFAHAMQHMQQQQQQQYQHQQHNHSTTQYDPPPYSPSHAYYSDSGSPPYHQPVTTTHHRHPTQPHHSSSSPHNYQNQTQYHQQQQQQGQHQSSIQSRSGVELTVPSNNVGTHNHHNNNNSSNSNNNHSTSHSVIHRSPLRIGRSGDSDAFSLDSLDLSKSSRSHIPSTTTTSSTTTMSRVFGDFDSSERASIFNLCNFILGSGIVALPAAFGQAGVVLGLCMLLLQACVTDYSLRLLISAGLQLKVFDYEELLRACFGRRGWMVGLGSIFALDFGVMVTFLIILSDTFTPVLSMYVGGPFTNRNVTLWIVSLLTVLPLSLLRSMKELSWGSMISVWSVIGIVILVGWKVITGGATDHVTSTKMQASSSSSSSSSVDVTFIGTNLFSAFGSFSFVFVCHDGSFALFQSFLTPTLGRWSKVVRFSIGVTILPSIFLGLCGHYGFYDTPSGVESNILNNFPFNDHLINLGRIGLGLSMIATYPLNLFMCRHVVTRISGITSVRHLNTIQHIVMTILLWFTTMLCASLLDDLGFVQALVGAAAGSLLAFVLPAAASIRTSQIVDGRDWFCYENIGKLALLGLGGLVMIVATYQTINGDDE